MADRSFAAAFAIFRDKTKAQMQAVLAESVQDVMDIAQTPVANGGRMPVDTGALINSVATELNGRQLGTAGKEDKSGAQSATNIALLVTEMQPGDVATIAWTAAHALAQHEGRVIEKADGTSVSLEGKRWVDGAAAQWPQIVERNVKRLK